MSKNTFRPTPRFIYLFAIGVFVVVGVAFKTIHQDGSSPLVPTKEVSKTTSIGGTQQSTKTTSTNKQSPPSQPASSPHSSTEPPSYVNAPKQEAIANTVFVNYPYKALGAVPNDPYFASSWAHQRTYAIGAWNISTGSPVTVAIIDTGFALNHEDLVSQWKINTLESGTTVSTDRCWTGTPKDRSTNGCDDDANGYIDDWRGWNFINATNNPQAGTTSADGIDAISHGTSVAGLAGAATNNTRGIASFNWNTKLMPLAALDDSGSGTTSEVIAALYYAVDNGASVVNLSLGGPASDPALQTAINYAYEHNVVVVAAAGNCGTTGDAGCGGLSAPTMMYPARNNHVIAVGASDSSDNRASFSSYGPGLDVIAPGSGTITSTLIDTRNTPYNMTTAYSSTLYGTSFASPIVTSIASLIRSLRPGTSVDDITALIDGSASKTSAMGGQVFTNEHGHGLINAATAASIADSLSKTTVSAPVLAQTGDHRSEHSYSVTAGMSSGCTAPALTYCTIRMTNTYGYDRYLPYKQTTAAGSIGWQWSGGMLQQGEWMLSAVQGALQSPNVYYLFSK